MMRQVSVERIFAENQARLGLHWVAGRQGGNRVLTGEAALRPTIGQVGHMNFIHPFRIQILGAAELAYLRALSQAELEASIDRLFTLELVAIVVANGEDVPPHLAAKCDANHIALFTSLQPSPHLVEVFRLFLSRVLAESTTLHGVFLDVLEMGVLVTGASAIGKSELALELISRGNGLIADDIVELYRISPDTLEGRCPAVLRDFLEVRGIGILNIRTIFGETAVRPRKLLEVHGPSGGPQQRGVLRARPPAGQRHVPGDPRRAGAQGDDPGRRRPQPRGAGRGRGPQLRAEPARHRQHEGIHRAPDAAHGGRRLTAAGVGAMQWTCC